jgi:hypothetical protein
MTFTVQVVVDCIDPHPLAAWWAETLGWQVEPQDEKFIRQMIDEGHASESDTTTHQGRLVWRWGGAITSGEPQHLRVLFQWVPEVKTVKNRLHFDVRTGEVDAETVRARLIERGATALYEGSLGRHTWATMADPEGNEFCV